MSALEGEGINKVALVAFKKNDIGNQFWENIGFVDRDDLVYRGSVKKFVFLEENVSFLVRILI